MLSYPVCISVPFRNVRRISQLGLLTNASEIVLALHTTVKFHLSPSYELCGKTLDEFEQRATILRLMHPTITLTKIWHQALGFLKQLVVDYRCIDNYLVVFYVRESQLTAWEKLNTPYFSWSAYLSSLIYNILCAHDFQKDCVAFRTMKRINNQLVFTCFNTDCIKRLRSNNSADEVPQKQVRFLADLFLQHHPNLQWQIGNKLVTTTEDCEAFNQELEALRTEECVQVKQEDIKIKEEKEEIARPPPLESANPQDALSILTSLLNLPINRGNVGSEVDSEMHCEHIRNQELAKRLTTMIVTNEKAKRAKHT